MGIGTLRYVLEAQEHVLEVYRLIAESGDETKAGGRKTGGADSLDRFTRRIMSVVELYERYEPADLVRQCEAWADLAISFLGRAPSAKARMRFENEQQRTLLLTAALYWGAAAVDWLQTREEEGLLRGG